MVAKKTDVAVGISLATLNIETVMIPIVGDSALICHRWAEKAIKEMLDKQMKHPNAGRVAKDPVADYEASLYRMPDGRYGFPSVAFKNAAVTACTSLSGVTKIAARQAFRVIGEMAPVKTVFNGSEMRTNLVAVEGSEPEMREDMVRIGMGVADIRYRGQFFPWKCLLAVSFNANLLSRDQIVNLFNTAGFAVGVGEWRQEKNGEYGAFHVDTKAFDDQGVKKSKR
jgi:hypothetical protein